MGRVNKAAAQITTRSNTGDVPVRQFPRFGRRWSMSGKARGAEPNRKYGNKKVIGYDLAGKEITLDSKREARRWAELVIRHKAGEIEQLERQITYTFCDGEKCVTYPGSNRKVRYVLDFRYIDKFTNELVHEDAKGFPTPDYKLKAAMMLFFHDAEVLEV